MSITVTFYHRPNGRQSIRQVERVRPEDAAWLTSHNIAVSMEDLGSDPGLYAVYFDYGLRDEEGNPIEHIEIAGARTCDTVLAAGVAFLKGVHGETVEA